MAYRHHRRRAKQRRIESLIQTPAPPTTRIYGRARAAMEHQFHGKLVVPGDADYETDRHAYNPAFEAHPQIIAYCETPGDVYLCLKWAHERGWQAVCRSGGHSTAGYCINDGMVIDLSRMSYVHVDPARRLASVGPGTTFGMLNAVLDHYDLHVPGGGCEDVAIAGYMQGGGWGFTSREFGMNCDNVESVRVMLSNGGVVEANQQRNPDLFWAIRGGTGNNFGIVLEVTYRLHPIDSVWGFGIKWTMDDAPAALAKMQSGYMIAGASNKLGYLTFFAPRGVPSSGNGTLLLLMRGLYHGPRDEGRRQLEPLLRTRGAELEFAATKSYRTMNYLLIDGKPPESPGPGPIYEVPDPWKEDKQSGFIERQLDEGDWHEIVDYFRKGPGPYNIAVIEPCGGAINASVDNAFIHRKAMTDFFVDVFWDDDAEKWDQVKWLNDYMELMKPYFNGHSYQNYPRRGLDDFRWMYWGDAYDTLLWVKQKYDPDNFFRFEQSISPYPAGTRPAHHPQARLRFTDRDIAYESYSRQLKKPK